MTTEISSGHGHPAPLFEALIVPHRSLSPAGIRRLALGLGGLGLLIGLRFWMLGAWPVLGFSVIEAGLLGWMLHVNMRRARASELVVLEEGRVRIIRTAPGGTRHERIVRAAWVNVELEERRGRTPRLLIGGRAEQVEIGDVLGEDEKRQLADALRDALYQARHPRFDNPQLR